MQVPVEINWYTVELFGLKFHLDTLFYTWLAMLIILALAFLARSSFRGLGKPAALFEHIYDYFKDLSESMIHKGVENYVPFVMTIFLFVLAGNWLGLIPGFIPFTRDYNTTLALAVISFIGFNYFGIRRAIEDAAEKSGKIGVFAGLGNWLAHFISPIPELWVSLEGALRYILIPFLLVIFLILNIMEEIMRIVSLSLRLMGNILGDHLILGVMLYLTLYMTQVWLRPLDWATSAFVLLLGALTGFIQAFIFAILSLSYIASAVEGH